MWERQQPAVGERHEGGLTGCQLIQFGEAVAIAHALQNIEEKRQDTNPLAIDVDAELNPEPVDAGPFLDIGEPVLARRQPDESGSPRRSRRSSPRREGRGHGDDG